MIISNFINRAAISSVELIPRINNPRRFASFVKNFTDIFFSIV